MDRTDITIQPLNDVHISKAVKIHSLSFPNSRTSKLGELFLWRMYQWYFLCQPQLSFVALQGSEVIGFVTGTMGWGGGRRRFKYTFWYIVWGFLRNPLLFLSADMFEAWKIYIRGLLPAPKKTQAVNTPSSIKFTLDSIAVHPDARGLNVGQALVSAFEKAAESQGATYLALGVECDNRPARRLYEKCGWKLTSETVENNSASYIKDISRI